MTRRRVVPIVVGIAVLAGLGVALTTGGSDDGAAGRHLPAVTLENLEDGKPPVDLAALEGKPLVVNFWASWCTPCKKELPLFRDAHARVGDEVAFVGVDTSDSRRNGLALARSVGVPYPSGFDPDADLVRRLRLPEGLPHTLFVSADGVVVGKVVGEIKKDALNEELDRIVGT